MKIRIYSVAVTISLVVALGFSYWQFTQYWPLPMNFGRMSSIDRVALIRQVGKGDADAAFRLGDYYSTSGVPEAAVFWFRKAVALGNKNIKMETIDLIETNIIQGEL